MWYKIRKYVDLMSELGMVPYVSSVVCGSFAIVLWIIMVLLVF